MIDKLHKISNEILGLSRNTSLDLTFCRTRIIKTNDFSLYVQTEDGTKIDSARTCSTISQYNLEEGKYKVSVYSTDGTLYYESIIKITKEMYNTIYVVNTIS